MNSIIPYPGGKSKVRDKLLALVPKHSCWVEVFCGACWVTLAKSPTVSDLEVINDKDQGLINLWMTIREKPGEFIAQAWFSVRSRAQFDRYKENRGRPRKPIPDVEAAWEYWYLIQNSFTGSIGYPRWKYSPGGGKPTTRRAHHLDLIQMEPRIMEVYRRLQKVDIECLDFRDCIDRYDRPGTFFFCFPPGQLIRTQNEQLIPIERINVDDVLFGGRSVQQRLQRRYSGELYSIRVQGVPWTLRVTRDHPILRVPARPPDTRQDLRTLDERRKQIELVPAHNLKKGDYLFVPLDGRSEEIKWQIDYETRKHGKRVPICFNIKSNEHKLFRLFGFYSAEGNLWRNKKGYVYGLTLTWNAQEDKLAEESRAYAQTIFIGAKVSRHPGQPNDSVQTVRITTANVGDFFNYYVPGKAHTKSLHPDLMTAPIKWQKELLRGWLDGDGGLYHVPEKNKYKLTGTTVSQDLAWQMYLIALRCGLRPSAKLREYRKDLWAWDIYFTCVEDIEALGYPVEYKVARPTRKILDNHILSRIMDIRSIAYDGLVYNLHVSVDSLLCASGIMVHNCDPPYWDRKSGPQDYAIKFTRKDHKDLAEILCTIKGKFLLTYDDSITVRDAYNWAHIKAHNFGYSVPHAGSAGESTTGQELIITNYDTAGVLGPLFVQNLDFVV